MKRKLFVPPLSEVFQVRLEENFTQSGTLSTGTDPVEEMETGEEIGW